MPLGRCDRVKLPAARSEVALMCTSRCSSFGGVQPECSVATVDSSESVVSPHAIAAQCVMANINSELLASMRAASYAVASISWMLRTGTVRLHVGSCDGIV